MTTFLDPRHSAGGGLDVDAPITIGELLDGKSRRVLAQAARDLGLGVHVTALHGDAIMGSPLALLVTQRAGVDLEPVEDPSGPGRRYLAQVLLHEGDPIGYFAVGPYPDEREAGVRRVATHLGHLVDHLLSAGLEKVYASRMHSASMEDAYAELQRKNETLAKAVERLQELDKIKSNFLATVSHELRTPLTSVIGYSEMLLEGIAGELNPEQRDYMRTVMEKGEQLLSIITQILDISRIEAGRVSLERQVFPVGDVVDVALSTVLPNARRKGVTVRADIQPNLPPLYADRDKVRQVLINLLGNAIKFTERGHVLVALARAADGRAVLRVEDSGIGIPEDVQARLFNRFVQADAGTTRRFGGTGLGLAITRRFCQLMGGDVTVTSQPGHGSTFTVTLPVTPPPGPATDPHAESGTPTEPVRPAS